VSFQQGDFICFNALLEYNLQARHTEIRNVVCVNTLTCVLHVTEIYGLDSRCLCTVHKLFFHWNTERCHPVRSLHFTNANFVSDISIQIILQQFSVGFARVSGEKGTALLLSYTDILAHNSEFRAIVFCDMCSDTQQIVHKFYIIDVRHCLGGWGWGGDSGPKLRVCEKRLILHSCYRAS
jgi:hypothetical protein